MRFPVLMVMLAMGGLAGCSSAPKYACGVPNGVGCKSVSEVYAGAKSRAGAGMVASTPRTGVIRADGKRPVVATVKPGEAVLTTPRYARMWVNRWEDAHGDMHDETFVYLRLDNGSWTMKR